MILEAGFEFPDLRGRSGETTEDAILRLLEQHRMINIALQESYFHLSETKSKSSPAGAATANATRNNLIAAEHDLRYARTELLECSNELPDCRAAVQDKTKESD